MALGCLRVLGQGWRRGLGERGGSCWAQLWRLAWFFCWACFVVARRCCWAFVGRLLRLVLDGHLHPSHSGLCAPMPSSCSSLAIASCASHSSLALLPYPPPPPLTHPPIHTQLSPVVYHISTACNCDCRVDVLCMVRCLGMISRPSWMLVVDCCCCDVLF